MHAPEANLLVGRRLRKGASAAPLNIPLVALHVGVDAWNLPGDRRGIGRYVREIINRWASWRPQRVVLTLLVPERTAWLARKRYLAELEASDIPVRHRAAARSLEVVFYPWNGMSWVAGVPSVATLHDASLFAAPPANARAAEQEQRPMRLAAALARRIITLSEHAKEELVRYLQLDPMRVDVIPVGVNETFARARPGAPGSSRPYILFVGEPEERKGLPTLLSAMALLPDASRSALELVLVGARGQYPLPPAPSGINLRNLGWVDDEELASLYAGAAALVYPSSYEGFGMPVVEALAAGAPVIAADIPAVREAAGDAARLVPARDPVALAAAIAEVVGQPAMADGLRARGRNRVVALSWDETARRTLAVLERAVAAP